MAAQRLDQGRQGPGEVSVLADTEPKARHVDRASKPFVVSVEADQLGTLGRAEHGRRLRVAPLPERALDLVPLQPDEPRLHILGHGREVLGERRAIIGPERCKLSGGRCYPWRLSSGSHTWSSPSTRSTSSSSTWIARRTPSSSRRSIPTSRFSCGRSATSPRAGSWCP